MTIRTRPGIWDRISGELVFRGVAAPYAVGDRILDDVKDLLGYHRFTDTVTVVGVVPVRRKGQAKIETLWRVLIRQG